jgi:hypothetical protein
MKYVIVRATRKDGVQQDFPFLFSEELEHKKASEHFKHFIFWSHDGKLNDAHVFSAGFFTPENGAIRGSDSLGITRCERNDEESIIDDNIICVNDQTKGFVR